MIHSPKRVDPLCPDIVLHIPWIPPSGWLGGGWNSPTELKNISQIGAFPQGKNTKCLKPRPSFVDFLVGHVRSFMVPYILKGIQFGDLPRFSQSLHMGSMYGIFTYIYHENLPSIKGNIPFVPCILLLKTGVSILLLPETGRSSLGLRYHLRHKS